MTRTYKAKNKGYTREDLENAIESVRSKVRSASNASRFFGVPRTTICNHIFGKAQGFKRGRKTALTHEAERALVEIILKMDEWAFPLDMDTLKIVVANYVRLKNLKTPFKNSVPGNDWCYG